MRKKCKSQRTNEQFRENVLHTEKNHKRKKVNRHAGRSNLNNCSLIKTPVDTSPRDKKGRPWAPKYYQKFWFCFLVIYIGPVIALTYWTCGTLSEWSCLIVLGMYGFLWAFGAPTVCMIIGQANKKYYLPGANIYVAPKPKLDNLGSGFDTYYSYHSYDGKPLEHIDLYNGMFWD